MRQEDYLYLRSLQEQVAYLEELGWSRASIVKIYLPDRKIPLSRLEGYFRESQVFGSPLFKRMWQFEAENLDEDKAQGLLTLAFRVVGMPSSLLGTSIETQQLLKGIDSSLSPHDPFWKEFSYVVQAAFVKDEWMTDEGNSHLKRQVHQFRYVISCQQAEWVRERFSQSRSDRSALLAYLAHLSSGKIWIGASARLHNKVAFKDGVRYYPDGQSSQANYKILLDFHTEFILDQKGNFLNELDPRLMTENGIVNGASFNYGEEDSPSNQDSHTRHDVLPPRKWDPAYRNSCIANQGNPFRSPENNRGERGYRSSKGWYATHGRSAYQHVTREVKGFKRALGWMKWKVYWHRIGEKLFKIEKTSR